jgi:hypothetical protein
MSKEATKLAKDFRPADLGEFRSSSAPPRFSFDVDSADPDDVFYSHGQDQDINPNYTKNFVNGFIDVRG